MQNLRPEFDAEEKDLASALSARKAACPPLDVLLAVGQDILPDEVEEAATAHIANCKLCSRLIADLATLPEAELTVSEQQRIASKLPLAQKKRTGATMQVILSVAALVVLCVGGLLVLRTYRSQPTQTAEHPPATPASPQAAVAEFTIPLTPLASPQDAAIVTRGNHADAEPAMAELLPAFTAYNHADYGSAARQFEALAKAHPNNDTIQIYLGVSELYLGKNQEAHDAMRLAETKARSDAPRNAARWYLAIAASRLHSGEARVLLQQLCDEQDPVYSTQSCALLKISN